LRGGEESGGYGFPRHLLDRDGILAGLLLVEYVAQQGKPLRSILDELAAEFGTMFYRRLDLPLKSCPQLCVEPPSRLGSRNVTAVETLDGLKLRLGDEGWILFRLSGTESVLRVYAEGKTEEAVREILRDGRQWIEDKIASEAVPAAYL